MKDPKAKLRVFLPKKRAIVKVPDLDLKLLEQFHRMPIKAFEKMFDRYDTLEGPFFFKNNGSNVLFVGHLDTVQPPRHFKSVKLSHDRLIFSPVHDSRTGVFAGVHLLPKMGIKCDILLTTGEEQGASTAAYFPPRAFLNKQYDFMFSMDRGGTDCVLYQYEQRDAAYLIQTLGRHGWNVSLGSYSDIRELEHLRCKGVNFGCGWDKSKCHSLNSFLSENDFISCVRNVATFLISTAGITMPHLPMVNTWDPEMGFYFTNYSLGSHNPPTMFSDADIELIERLEKEDPAVLNRRILKEDIVEIIAGKETTDKIEKIRARQIAFNFAKERAIEEQEQIRNGSSVLRELDLSALVMHSGLADTKEVIKEAQKQKLPVIGVSTCTTCHSIYDVSPDDTKSICPKCLQEENSHSLTSPTRKLGNIIKTKSLFIAEQQMEKAGVVYDGYDIKDGKVIWRRAS